VSILTLNEKIEEVLLSDRTLEQKVFVELTKMISSAYQHAMQQTELNYCFKFNLPYAGVSKRLYKIIGITPEETFKGFKEDWGKSAMTNNMHKDSYYHILLLLMYYGLKNKKQQIVENSFFILLMKIWNGRREKYMPVYCDPKIMAYVISNMNKKYITAKFDSPLFMLKDYFVPTLLKKYTSNILRNPGNNEGLKRIFEQSWARIVQLWANNKQTNLKTGKSENIGGLLPLYMKAHQDGSALKSITGSDDDEASYMSVNEREIIANDISDFITTTNNKYSQTYMNSLYRITNVNQKTIPILIDGLHDYSLFDDINDLVLLLLSRLNINDKQDICKFDIYSRMKKMVISSKNNIEVQKIRRLCNHILNKIFIKKQIDIKVEKMTLPSQGKIRNLILILILTNIKKLICHEKIPSTKLKLIGI